MASNHEHGNTTIKILEQIQVSPPPGSVPQTLLPLSFLDLLWLLVCPVQRLFFYQIPHTTHHFTHTILPNLKHSLSAALRHFFPLAATLVLPPPSQSCPYLLYEEGGSVPLTIAESSADFNNLISNVARDVKDLHPFVPELSQPSQNGVNHVGNVLALQITVFPNSGICVGVTYNHCVGDGRSITHFMKLWAAICKTPTTSVSDALVKFTPSHDRDAIRGSDDQKYESSLQSFYSWAWNYKYNGGSDLTHLKEKVRATFVMGRTHINKLKKWVTDQLLINDETQTLYASTFVVTSAFTWVHLIKLQTIGSQDDDKICYFPISADCRNKKVFEFPIPATYFGNCLILCNVAMKRSELVGENGIFLAAKAIATRIMKLGSGTILVGVEKYILDLVETTELFLPEEFFSIAGSPNLRIYEIDFGWGKPKKCEIVHIEGSEGTISLAESREEEGGIEIGVALHKDKMDKFAISFKQSLEVFMNG